MFLAHQLLCIPNIISLMKEKISGWQPRQQLVGLSYLADRNIQTWKNSQPVTVTLQESPMREECSVDKYLRRYRNTGLMQYLGGGGGMCFSCIFVDGSLKRKYFLNLMMKGDACPLTSLQNEWHFFDHYL